MQTRARQTGMPAAAWGGGKLVWSYPSPLLLIQGMLAPDRPLEGELGSGVRRPREGQ